MIAGVLVVATIESFSHPDCKPRRSQGPQRLGPRPTGLLREGAPKVGTKISMGVIERGERKANRCGQPSLRWREPDESQRRLRPNL
jgi:hypothetical protein